MATIILGHELTYQGIVALAERNLGCRKAVLEQVQISRQRLAQAMAGGPPLKIERLVKLATIARVHPFDVLRAGGRGRFADSLEEALRPEVGPLSAIEREMLTELAKLPPGLKASAVRMVALLAWGQSQN